MRQRATSAAILVPLLLIVVALGGMALSAAIAVLTVLAAREVFALLRSAGHPALSALGSVLALTVILDAAVPNVLEGSGLLLIAIGVVLVAAAAFTRSDPRDGLATWMATLFGAIYVSLLAFVVRLGYAGPTPPDSAPLAVLGAERGWIVLLILAVWAYDTGAFLIGRRFGRERPHHRAIPDSVQSGSAQARHPYARRTP